MFCLPLIPFLIMWQVFIKLFHQLHSTHLFFPIILFVVYIQIAMHLFTPIQFQSYLISIFIVVLFVKIAFISIINTITFMIVVIIIIIIINNSGRYEGLILLGIEKNSCESFDSLSST
jgi:hypothetical protein